MTYDVFSATLNPTQSITTAIPGSAAALHTQLQAQCKQTQ